MEGPAPLARRPPEWNGNAPVVRQTTLPSFRERVRGRGNDRLHHTLPRNPGIPLALFIRLLQAYVLVLATLLVMATHTGPMQDFAAVNNGSRAHLFEHWAATSDAGRLAFLEALCRNHTALDSHQQPFPLGAD